MPSASSSPRSSWLLLGLTLFTFFFLLGTRSLNEPDEGRYAEIAREMVETGDWLVPTIWYVPHLDKPPLTYWAVAVSLKLFGLNEWAVRLPVALAGLSGVWAAWLLGLSLGGRGTARWSVLILLSSVLYFAMSRMLTTDIFLTQFVVWSVYLFWRCWRSLDGLSDADEDRRARAARKSFIWQVLGWAALAGGFLTKGPVALAIPAAAFGALLFFRRREAARLNVLLLGAMAGVTLFSVLALPWYFMVFDAQPAAFDFMVKNRLAGHALGTTVKNRGGSPFYFIGILAVGFLPWTPLLGWLWRKAHWRSLSAPQKEGWVMLSAWVIFTFVLFSLNKSKLPAYILPLFPALAVMIALRWPDWKSAVPGESFSNRLWLGIILGPVLLLGGFLAAQRIVFKVENQNLLLWLVPIAAIALVTFHRRRKAEQPETSARVAVGASLAVMFCIILLVPGIETRLKNNQTLKPIGVALRAEFRPGDRVVIWGRLPQGLPFYAYPAISAIHRPYLGGLPMDRMPFEFPGNQKLLETWLVPDIDHFRQMLSGDARVLVVANRGTFATVRNWSAAPTARMLAEAGEWEMFANR